MSCVVPKRLNDQTTKRLIKLVSSVVPKRLNDQTTKRLIKTMKKIFLFSWEQLLKLVGLLKPIIELVKEVIDIFKKDKDDEEQ